MNDFFNKEWIVTNGIGGYASGTVAGANTRRYHGLLVSALNPPTDRTIFVAKIEERIVLNGKYTDLSENKYPNKVHPQGTQFLKHFEASPNPKWKYANNEFELEKRIKMMQGSNTTLVSYVNKGKHPLEIEVHPLYAYNRFHSTFKENGTTDFYTEVSLSQLKTFPEYGSTPFYTSWDKGNYKEARAWYKNVQLPREKERGMDYKNDFYRIGYLRTTLAPGEEQLICFTTDENMAATYQKPRIPKKVKINGAKASNFYEDLLRSGNQFLVERNSTKNKSIIAGYHWFADWGRDTMIAMRGLTIAVGDKKTSKELLTTFLKSVDKGMIPNRFPDYSDDPVKYNTIDATLWLFTAMYEYHQKFKDNAFIKKQIPVLKDILDWHIKGTRYQIHVTEEGFLYGGEDGVQLTWMDAIVNEKVITPRIGCPVEINALWYNALKIYEHFCEDIEQKADSKYLDLILKFESNFAAHFTNNEGTLYDVIVPNKTKDNCFRPNQLFWLSLPFTVLKKPQEKLILDQVTEKLLTPYGLRTLDPENPEFKAMYEGDVWQRDHAYHQGTVWTFILYEYYSAYFKIYGTGVKNKKQVLKQLQPLREHFYSHEGLHCISEVFDGLSPFEGKGCIQQAWSVAALVKLYVDYELFVLDKTQSKAEPKYSVV